MEKKVKFKRTQVWNDELQRYELKVDEVYRYIYSEEEKIQIVSEHICEQVPIDELVHKYHIGSRQTVINWVDRYLSEVERLSLPCEPESELTMSEQSLEEKLKALEAENQRLQKALELEKLRSKAYDTMITLAEETFNIPVRKKSGTKQ